MTRCSASVRTSDLGLGIRIGFPSFAFRRGCGGIELSRNQSLSFIDKSVN